MKSERLERGWGGHFICSDECLFRRNTLVTNGEKRIVVSTVGLMKIGSSFETVGCERYFETMAFEAKFDGKYWDADVSRHVDFESPWSIGIIDAENQANEMHENVVNEIMLKLEQETQP